MIWLLLAPCSWALWSMFSSSHIMLIPLFSRTTMVELYFFFPYAGWHLCNQCGKNAYFLCYTCTFSLCKGCSKDAAVFCVRGSKGFCDSCMKTVMVIESSEQNEMVHTRFLCFYNFKYLFSSFYFRCWNTISRCWRGCQTQMYANCCFVNLLQCQLKATFIRLLIWKAISTPYPTIKRGCCGFSEPFWFSPL